MNMPPTFLTLNFSCGDALQWSSQNLTRNGLRVMQTFDLSAARHALEDNPCPLHGVNECNCQMVVLLVYGKTGGPVSLILHGNDGQTRISLVDNSIHGGDGSIRSVIEAALQPNSTEGKRS